MKKIGLLLLILIVSFFAIWTRGVIPQNQAYHLFVDNRNFLGIPNFFDTTTNIFFFIPGVMGVFLLIKNKPQKSFYSWLSLFLGVTLVAFGSAYYHLLPNDETLVWDRIPMTIGFMGAVSAVISEATDFPFEKYFLAPLIGIGILSVFVWVWTGDLRFYYFIQLAPLVTVPAVLLIFPRPFSHNSLYLIAVAFYLAAKITEHRDGEIYNVLSLSGHSIKHILAAASPYALYLMLKKRKPTKAL